MAKKKMNRQSDDHKQQAQEQIVTKEAEIQNENMTHIPTMAEACENLERLKSLNQMLLKETTERRKQVESLVKGKEDLQFELIRSGKEKESLVAELSEMKLNSTEMEWRRGVMSTFVETQLSEWSDRFNEMKREKDEAENVRMKKEAYIEVLTSKVNELVDDIQNKRNRLSEVSQERDNLKRDLDGFVAESIREKDKLMEMEIKVRELKTDMEKLRYEEQKLKDEAGERKTELEALIVEKGRADKKLSDSELIIMGLKDRDDVIHGEKKLLNKIVELEGKVVELNESLLCKQMEEEALRTQVMEERDCIEQLNLNNKNEMLKMRDEARELCNDILELRERCRSLEEKNQEFTSVIDNLEADFSSVKDERDLLKICLDEQGCKVENLTSKISELEKNLGQTKMEYSKMKTEKKELVEKKQILEWDMQILKEEKDMLLKCLRESKEEFNDLSAKVELAATNSIRDMTMLKYTAAVICQSKDDKDNGSVFVNEKECVEENEPFAMHLLAIKDAFNKKLEMVKDMEEEIASLQKSVAESQNRKSFLTVLSSVTTIFAAASVAYAARGR